MNTSKSKIRKFITRMNRNRIIKNRFAFKYPFMFTPPQLCFICQCIEQLRDVEGAIVEVGCAWGRTTVFINKYMEAQNIEKKYLAIDTFSGFTNEDIKKENPDFREYYKNHSFQFNSKKYFDYEMTNNGIKRVESIQVDVNKLDLSKLGQLCFVLLDVDLYRPTKKSIEELFRALNPGGMIIVDDCNPDVEVWEGAYRAYMEFINEINQPTRIVYKKLGLIRKER